MDNPLAGHVQKHISLLLLIYLRGFFSLYQFIE